MGGQSRQPQVPGNPKAKALSRQRGEGQGLYSGLHNGVNDNCLIGMQKGCRRCQIFCAQSMKLESTAIFNPKLAENAKQIASKAVCQNCGKLLGPQGSVRK